MAWILDIFKKWLDFFTGSKGKQLEQELLLIRADKERIGLAVKKLSERADHLNEHYKQIMAESDRFGLDQVKKHFLQVNDSLLKLRDEIGGNVERLKVLSETMNQPWVAEALDEYEEMNKALSVIQKHHKAVQHMEIKAPAKPVPQAKAPEKTGPAESQKAESEPAPKPKPEPSRKAIPTALENMQSQSTVLIQITDDMYDEMLLESKKDKKEE